MSVPERIDNLFTRSPATDGSADSALLVRHLFACHPLPMLVYDVETLTIVDVNDAMTTSCGYARDELLGMHITRLLPPGDVPDLLEVIRETVRPGRAPYRPPTLWRHLYKNGQVRDVEITAHDYNLDDRETVLVTVTNVTDRLRAERQRDDLLARLRQEVSEKAAIIEQMVDAVLVADASGRVVLANRAAFELFDVHGSEWPELGYGVPPRAAVPWTMFDVSGNELPLLDRPFARALRGETVRTEVRVVTLSGRESWVSVTAGTLRDEHGTMTGVVWLGREMTEERSRREREVRGEKLRALGQMASGVAHDLNQYLGLVAGYGDLTARSLDGPSPNLAAAREALEVVVHAETEAVTSLRVLVVDDEPTITRMVAMMLGPHGHDITIATSAEEALDRIAAAAEPFDLILSDLGLGDGMNGWDLLDRVRACTPGTRFILSTGWGAQIDPADIVARGGEGLLAKPYRLSDLLDAIAGPRG